MENIILVKMKLQFNLIVFLISLVACAQAQKLEVLELNHGIYEVEVATTMAAPKTLTQTYNLLKSQKLIQTTDTIIANIGKTFGVEFMVKATDNQTYYKPLKIVWEFPKPMTNPTTKKVYTESIMDNYFFTGMSTFHSYTLEYDYEFVEGWWTFKIMQGDTVLYTKKFLLINMT